MNTYAQQKLPSQSHAPAHTYLPLVANGLSSLQLARSETVDQEKLDETLNQSPRVSSQLGLQEVLNRSPRLVAQAQMARPLSARTTLLQPNPVIQRQDGPLQRKENNTAMPDNLKTGIEKLSGMAMDDVKVHYNSAKPTQLHALAYTQGADIHVGPGQEKHLPHETWHAVQQKQGRVQPTMQSKGVAVNDDTALEREADVMGERAARAGASVQLLRAGGCSCHAGAGRAPDSERASATESTPKVIQGRFVHKDFSLTKYIPKIREYLETNHDEKVVKSFDRLAANENNNDFEAWAEKNGVDWKHILTNIVGYKPEWEEYIFGEELRGGRMTGGTQFGYVPQHPEQKEKKMLVKAKRGEFDYTSTDDRRILQLLRQLSTQMYLYLQNVGQLGIKEQEIQTMWLNGNLIIASNNPVTTKNLHRLLTTTGSTRDVQTKLHQILTQKYAGKKAVLTKISERHGEKIKNLYQGIRLLELPEIQMILNTLLQGSVNLITDIKDETKVKEVRDNSGNIYILSAPSPENYSHAEQRLIEFSDIVYAYKADPIAWVAGKKRPCFGCWIREFMTNKNYKLVYQDQPGKAFVGTYRAAPPKEKGEWVEKLKEKELAVYESEIGQGEIGPESASEAESEIDYSEPDVLMQDIAQRPFSGTKRKALDFHFKKAGVEYDKVERYVKRRKTNDDIDNVEEERLEEAAEKIKQYSKTSLNPAVPKMFHFESKKYTKRQKM